MIAFPGHATQLPHLGPHLYPSRRPDPTRLLEASRKRTRRSIEGRTAPTRSGARRASRAACCARDVHPCSSTGRAAASDAPRSVIMGRTDFARFPLAAHDYTQTLSLDAWSPIAYPRPSFAPLNTTTASPRDCDQPPCDTSFRLCCIAHWKLRRPASRCALSCPWYRFCA